MLRKVSFHLFLAAASCLAVSSLYASRAVVPSSHFVEDVEGYQGQYRECFSAAVKTKSPDAFLGFLRNYAELGHLQAQETLHRYLSDQKASTFIGLDLMETHRNEAEILNVRILRHRSKTLAEALLNSYLEAKNESTRKVLLSNYHDACKPLADPQPYIEALLLVMNEPYKDIRNVLEQILRGHAIRLCREKKVILHRDEEVRLLEKFATGGKLKDRLPYLELRGHLLNDSNAICIIAEQLLDLSDSLVSKRRAYYLYLKAAELKDISAIYKVGLLLSEGICGNPEDKSRGLQFLLSAAKLGHVLAMVEAGVLETQEFEGHLPNKDKALELFLNAAKHGNSVGMRNAAISLENKADATPEDIRQSHELYRNAVELGDSIAMTNLGKTYELAMRDECKKQALELYRQAAALGDKVGMFNAGKMFMDGFNGQPVDKEQALNYFLEASKLGHISSMFYAAILLEHGYPGRLPDKKQALDLYLEAAELGDNDAAYNAGILLEDGFPGQVSDKRQALALYLKAAEFDSDAMHNAGLLLEKGFAGQKPEKDKALAFYIKASELGNKRAMLNAGLLLESGFPGQCSDKRRALDFYLKAAKHNVRYAMIRAGLLLEKGFDWQEADKHRALELFLKGLDLISSSAKSQ